MFYLKDYQLYCHWLKINIFDNKSFRVSLFEKPPAFLFIHETERCLHLLLHMRPQTQFLLHGNPGNGKSSFSVLTYNYIHCHRFGVGCQGDDHHSQA